jgi:hypothetical protein
MVRYGIALAALLSATTTTQVNSFQSFQPDSLKSRENISSRRGVGYDMKRDISASSSTPEYPNGDALGEAVMSVAEAARDTLSKAVSDEPDASETGIALKKRQVQERSKTYKVTLPLTASRVKANSILSTGLTFAQISKGRTFSEEQLSLDSLRIGKFNIKVDDENVQAMDREKVERTVDTNFQGVVVSTVIQGSAAWTAGVRAGDMLKSTSATLGDALWPKSTLEGVLSAVSSRRASSGSIQLEFQRMGNVVDNQFELTLTRPLGMELKGKQQVAPKHAIVKLCRSYYVLVLLI